MVSGTVCRAVIAILACLAAMAAGCRDEGAPVAGTADRPTVVSLVPSVTEIIFALGEQRHLVGRSRYCTWPPEAERLPVLGDALTLNLEKLLVMRPDVAVFNTSNTRFYDRLHEAGIRCLAPRMESVDDVYAVIELLGRELDCAAEAEALEKQLRDDLAAVRAAAAAAVPVPTLVTFPSTIGGGSEVLTVGRETFVDELLVLAGGRNVVPSTGYPRVSVETVVTWAPELIVISAPGDIAPGLTDQQYRDAWSRWQAIPAVRDGRLVVLRAPYLTLPGPRMGAAARLLLGVLHPDRAKTLEEQESRAE